MTIRFAAPLLVGMVCTIVLIGFCQRQSDARVRGIEAEAEGLKDQIGHLEQNLGNLAAEAEGLKDQIGHLEQNLGNLAAEAILVEWSRDVPQSQRIDNHYQALRDSLNDPGIGAAAQLNRAMVRTANVAALTVIRSNLQLAGSEARQLEILNQCMEYLLGITSSIRSCNLMPISPGR